MASSNLRIQMSWCLLFHKTSDKYFHPNPATSDIVSSNNLKGADPIMVVTLDNLTAIIEYEERFVAESTSGKTIDVSEFDPGMYTLRLISSVARDANFKVILE